MKKLRRMCLAAVFAALFALCPTVGARIVEARTVGVRGALVASTDFEGVTVAGQYQYGAIGFDASFASGARVSGAGGTVATLDDPTGSGRGAVLKGEHTAPFRSFLEIDGMVNRKGVYTVEFDVYSTQPYLRVDMFGENKGVNVTANRWERARQTFTVSADGEPSGASINLYSLAAGVMYVDNVCVWFRPENSLVFNDGAFVLYEDGASPVLPSPSAFGAGHDDDGFLHWSDGTASYAAGTAVPASSFADKVLTAVWNVSAPATLATLNKAQLNLIGAPGMRVAGFVGAPDRERASEYGFIVAQKSAFDGVGGDYETYLVFPAGFDTANKTGTLAIGKPFACGAAYKPDANVDVIYATDGAKLGAAFERSVTGGGVYFVGLLTGQTGSQYKDDLVARPYLCSRGQIFYGTPVVRSMYALAAAYKSSGVNDARVDEILAVKGRTYDASYSLIDTVTGNGREGLANGWEYDNRFEFSNFTGVKKNYLFDDSDTTFTALRRTFNAPETEGLLHGEMLLTLASADGGAYIAFEDEDGERAAEITEIGGKWALVGTETAVSDKAFGSETRSYAVVADLDLDRHVFSVRVDGTPIGSVSIASDAAVKSLALGTNARGTASVTLSSVKLDKNLPVSQRFLGGEASGWTTAGSVGVNSMASESGSDVYSLKLTASASSPASAQYAFEGVYGKVDVRTFILLPEKADGASFSLMDGGRAALTLTFENGYVKCGDTSLRAADKNVWHELHVVADTENGGALVKIDGKNAGSVPFEAISIDGAKYTLSPDAAQTMWIDDLAVRCAVEPDDYPSAPVKADSTGYNIGVNVCSLWRDGHASQGWDTVSALAEYEPILGYYDEGSPELADWEIKFLAEHGVDFFQTCWYAPDTVVTAPIKRSQMSHAALHDGYMNAKYSDDVKFAILWENAYGGVNSLEQFKTYVWPYWKAYYFSDDRYMTLDGKALLSVYVRANFIDAFGSETNAKAAVDFMDSELKAMGYDGLVLLFASGSTSSAADYQSLVNIGGDGTFAYGWGEMGMSPYFQKMYNTDWSTRASAAGSVHLPTVATGYNPLGGTGERHAVITNDNFRTALTDAKAILDGRSGSTWQSKTLFLSNWNEFFEGSVIFPTKENGFGYLDAVRSVFTSAAAHTDALPTSLQKARVGRLYHQDRTVLKRLATKRTDGVPERLAAIRSYSMATSAGRNGWESYYGGQGMTSYSESSANGWITGTANADEYSIGTTNFDPMLAVNAHYMHIRMYSTGLGNGQIYFTTVSDTAWNEAKSFRFRVEKPGEFVDYYVDLKENSLWSGTVKAVRIDPVNAPGTFRITDIDFMYKQPLAEPVPTVTVNGRKLSFTFDPERIRTGGTTTDFTVRAEQIGRGFFSMMRLYHEWDRHNGRLTLKTRDGDEIVFTSGANTVAVNGVNQPLGYVFELYDGLPVFRIKALCELLGYDYEMTNDGIVIFACTDEERERIEQTMAYRWEFNSAAETGSWTARQCTVSFSGDGCMTVTATDTDAGISHTVALAAADCPVIRIGFRYTPSMDGKTGVLYFSSDTTGGMGADNSFTIAYDTLTAGKNYGDLVLWEIDTAARPTFAGNITGLRFDPSWSTGDVFRIDFIRCMTDDDNEKGIDVSSLFD